ncbi:hypothetical protein Mag101_08530 [Microbulbifer agarilyticus]|uniref:DUF2092 domain-containing protein n=1 Tax=Microbulbifer agarilyticus TaxID=260552 RepID=A0A1Q2M5X5_9GAMM|nr:DUF2092 domain-containing protein [Microbulbifer agarilyticus]AQQ67677.1 hypothetical protein Mag101_08530 [Microbulbifer agarilyticus]
MNNPSKRARRSGQRLITVALGAALITGIGAATTPSVFAAIGRHASQAENAVQSDQASIKAAYEALNAMGKTLASQQKLAYDIKMVTDVITGKGKKMAVNGTASVRFERPDHLFVDLKTDTMERQFYHDGNQFTVIAKKDGYYGQLPASASTREVLIKTAKDYGIEIPVVDLLEWGTPEARKIDLKKAKRMGETTLDGKAVEHWALHSGGLDWEIWITTGDKRLPMKLITTNNHLPEKPQFTAEVHWRDASSINDTMFSPHLSSDLKPITFNKIQPAPEAGQ